MARKSVSTRAIPHYYTIFQVNGKYREKGAANFIEANEDLEDIAHQGAIPVAIYDVYDWNVYWRLPADQKRNMHEEAVLDITEKLRLKHE